MKPTKRSHVQPASPRRIQDRSGQASYLEWPACWRLAARLCISAHRLCVDKALQQTRVHPLHDQNLPTLSKLHVILRTRYQFCTAIGEELKESTMAASSNFASLELTYAPTNA